MHDKFLHKIPKSKLYAWIGTIVSGIIILLILFFVVLPELQHEEGGGVMISFGDASEGGGIEGTSAQSTEQASESRQEKDENVLTQQDASIALSDAKRRQEEAARAEAEQRLQQEKQAAQQADELMGDLFGSSTGGSGRTSGETIAGNPVGKGNMDGNSWSLDGRGLLGSMPRPAYSKNTEGYLTVEIRVNDAGEVISARIQKGTISDNTIRNAAIDAAKKTRFSSGRGTVTGTITYNFKLN
jgi:colicin import membrane protein